MNDQRRTTSQIKNVAAIVLCVIAVIGCVAMVGVHQAYRVQRLQVEAQRAELKAEKALANSAITKHDVPKNNASSK